MLLYSFNFFVLVLAANREKMNISLEEQSLEERILEF
jgi:hypothetical protein